MKRVPSPRSLVIASFFAATALAGPAFAQAVATPETPTVTATQPAPAPAAPVATANPVFAPNAEVVQPTPPRAEPVAQAAPEAPAAAPVQRRAATRAAVAPRASAPARAAATASPAAPVAAAPVETLTPPAEAEAPAEIAPTPIPESSVETPVAEPVSTLDLNWLWLALAIVVSGVAAVMLLGRRKRPVQDYAYADDDAIEAPAAAAVTEVDLDARPFIRLSVQPVGQRDRDGEQLVDYLVLVENEGKIEARDVRVSQFVTSDGGGIPAAPETRRIDVASGSSIPLEGEIALHGAKAAHIVIDARYPLPDGREGRLAARFGIDLTTPEMAAEVEDVMERV